jgi:acyl-CoA thioester hydrolase
VIKHTYHSKIYYKDIDQMGIVYYSRYFELFEAARTELLQSIGLEVTEIEKSGTMLPVISAHCDYKVGIKFEAVLQIESVIKALPASTLRIDYSVFSDRKQILHADGYTIHAFINSEGKAVRPPKFVRDRISEAI